MAIDPNTLRLSGDMTFSMMQQSAREGVTRRAAGEPVLDQQQDPGCCPMTRLEGAELHRCSRPVQLETGRHPGLHRCAQGDWWTHTHAYMVWSDSLSAFVGFDETGATGYVGPYSDGDTLEERLDDARVMTTEHARAFCATSSINRIAWEWAPKGRRPKLMIPYVVHDWPVPEIDGLIQDVMQTRDEIESALAARDHWSGKLQNPVAVEMVTKYRELIGKPPIPLP